jgi:cell division protein FtsZ
MVQLNRQYERDNSPDQSMTIKVIGVGGAGSNVLDRVMLDGVDGVEMVVINTDVQSLAASVAAQKVQLGRNLTRGLGAGGDPELGLAAAEEAAEEIRSVLQGATVVFLCLGLGGGTGSGAGPWIARLAREEHALVLAFAAVPFAFEGRRRCSQAEASLRELRAMCDSVICFENDRMAEITLPRMGVHEAFAAADLTISQSIRSLANLLQRPGLLKIGFDDVASVLRGGDARALFGFGEAEGENRAHDALTRALKNPLLHRGELLENAFHAIIHIRGGTNVTLGEVQIVMEELNRHINDETQLFMGIAVDPRMSGRLAVSILSSLGQQLERPAPKITSSFAPEFAGVNKAALEFSQIEETPQPALALQTVDLPSTPTSQKSAAPPALLELDRPERTPPPKVIVKAAEPNTAPPKKVEAKQETLQFEPVSRGRFEKSEPTIVDGQDLDVPTFLRRHIRLK